MPDKHTPQDPLTALGSTAAEMHEIYLAYRKAGFSADEALKIVTEMLNTMVRYGLENQ